MLVHWCISAEELLRNVSTLVYQYRGSFKACWYTGISVERIFQGMLVHWYISGEDLLRHVGTLVFQCRDLFKACWYTGVSMKRTF